MHQRRRLQPGVGELGCDALTHQGCADAHREPLGAGCLQEVSQRAQVVRAPIVQALQVQLGRGVVQHTSNAPAVTDPIDGCDHVERDAAGAGRTDDDQGAANACTR